MANILFLLEMGDSLQMVREPDNRFDQKAVARYWRGDKLGSLPRSENTTITQMLDWGELLVCRIDSVNQQSFRWGAVKVRVEMG